MVLDFQSSYLYNTLHIDVLNPHAVSRYQSIILSKNIVSLNWVRS